MAKFLPAFEKMIHNEGGYVNHTVADDRGGQTFAGIARTFHAHWEGWDLIDRNDMDNPRLTELVREFYQNNFWNAVKGDAIDSQAIAENLFDFGVNAGTRIAIKLAQLVSQNWTPGRKEAKSNRTVFRRLATDTRHSIQGFHLNAGKS